MYITAYLGCSIEAAFCYSDQLNLYSTSTQKQQIPIEVKNWPTL